MNINYDSITGLGYTLLQLVLVIGILFLVKHYRAFYTRGIDDFELMQKHKVSSAGISMFGFLSGMTIIIVLAFGGKSMGLINDGIQILFTSIIGMLLLSLNSVFVDGLILQDFKSEDPNAIEKKVRVKDAINNNVLSIGVLQAFGFISAAAQFYFANQGVDQITIGLFMISVPYFIFGQIIVVLGMAGFIAVTSYDDHKELFKGNVAVSTSHGFLMLSISVLVGTVSNQALSLDPTTAVLIFIYSFISILIMIFGPKLLAGLFLRGVLKENYDGKIEKAVADGQVDIASIYGLMRLIVAIVIASSFPFNIFTI